MDEGDGNAESKWHKVAHSLMIRLTIRTDSVAEQIVFVSTRQKKWKITKKTLMEREATALDTSYTNPSKLLCLA
jgi:hypothetical protein